MNNQVLFKLICTSQFSTEKIEKEFETIDWDAVYQEAIAQAVIGLVAHEVPDSLLSVDSRWKQAVYRQHANYIRYCRAEDELKRVLDSVGIPFVILKGNAAAVYYKNPEYRKMGDIDFIVPQKDFSKTNAVLLQNGYEPSSYGERPRHIGYKKNGIEFELHHHFSYEDMDIEDVVIDGLNHRVTRKIGVHEFPVLPPGANGLVLLDHMKCHLKSGMGLRQVIDWMMYVNAELHDDEWLGGFEKSVFEKGMWKFAKIATKMCQMYLGLPTDEITWCKDADGELCRRLMAIVMNSGNFGNKNNAGNNIETIATAFRREGFFRRLQRAGEHNWRAYKKHHWLRPFCWIYQLFRYISRGLKTGRMGKKMNEDIKRSKERAEVLKEMGI